jgi:hypothetical protein
MARDQILVTEVEPRHQLPVIFRARTPLRMGIGATRLVMPPARVDNGAS